MLFRPYFECDPLLDDLNCRFKAVVQNNSIDNPKIYKPEIEIDILRGDIKEAICQCKGMKFKSTTFCKHCQELLKAIKEWEKVEIKPQTFIY